MKKKFINTTTSILSIILILSVSSCSKERSESGVNGVSSEKIRITGADANTTTKTTLNGLVTSWIQTTDKVGIYAPSARTQSTGGVPVVNVEFTAASSAFSSNFTGTMYWGAENSSHTFYAYYPYASGSPAATAVPVSLPAAQTQSSANSNAHIGALDFMVATPVTVTSPANIVAIANEVNLKYNHLFTVLEFQIKGTGQLKAVKLSANSTLAFSGGTIDITQAAPATGVAYTMASQTGTSNEAVVTLTTPATLTATNTDTKVYMVINPGLQTGNCLIGISTDGTTWKYITKTALAGGFLRGNKYVVSVDASIATEPVDDVDGNTYSTVMIGSQIWMGSNLKTTKYNDGSAIPYVENVDTWKVLSTGAYCFYNNNVGTDYGATYGALYNWYAVNTGKLCPTGWHVPTSTDWSTLATTLEGGNYAGGKLKETGTTHWTNNNGASDVVGFTALPGGRRKYDGAFEYIGTKSLWWTSTINGDFANYKSIDNTSVVLGGSYDNHKNGRNVRCVKD